MTGQPALFRLLPERHRDARLIPGIDLAPEWLTHYAEIGLDEVAAAGCDYPLVFLKNPESGLLRLVALFGLEPGNNLYVRDGIWQAVYLPLQIAAMPFCLGGPDRELCINEANPRVTTDAGEELFNADGTETATLINIRALLDRLEQGFTAGSGFAQALLQMDLIQPLTITAHFGSGEAAQISGLYSINPERLNAIEPAALVDLRAHDYLAPAYTIIQSLNQMNRIRELHNLGSNRAISAFQMVMQAG